MSDALEPPFLADQRRVNRATADAWDLFAEHRARVTDHLMRPASQASPPRSLCLLGIGNASDVDLNVLRQGYARIDLVDYDLEAMAAGLARQGLVPDMSFRLTGGVDLSGLAHLLGAPGSLASASDEAITNLVAAADSAKITLPAAEYTVVASLCMLSQIVNMATQALGDDHPRHFELIDALRRRHLRLLLDHARPGGLAMLVTDFVSSDTCPELLTLDSASVARAADKWLAERNFFTGLNPRALHQLLQEDPGLSGRLRQVQLVAPWKWQLSPRRAFAVCALKMIVGPNTRNPVQ